MENQAVQNPNMASTNNPVPVVGNSWIKRLKNPQMIFLVLGLVIVVELVLTIKSVLSPASVMKPVAASPQALQGGKMLLYTDKTQYQVGETIPVQIRIFTGGKPVDGTDAIVKYDTNALDITKAGLQTGSLFKDYPLVEAGKGVIRVSGVATFNQPSFNGLGVLATLNFKAKKLGPTTVAIDYTSGSTTGSNLIQAKSAANILASTTNLNLTIGNESGSSPQSSCSPRVFQQCVDSAGKTGSYWCSGLNDNSSCQPGCYQDEKSNSLGCKIVIMGATR